MNGLDLFPKLFKQQERFAELQKVTDEITNHPAMKVSEEYILHNMIQASLIFTVCFYSNLMAALHAVVKKLAKNNHFVPTDNRVLHLFLQLASEELATKNIPTKDGLYSPHYVSMLEAAQYAGVDTLKVETYVSMMGEGKIHFESITEEIGFSKELHDYMLCSLNSCRSDWGSVDTIALRELTLSANFKVILANLPDEEKYSKYRHFLSAHVELDSGDSEENHGQLMLGVLQDMDETRASWSLGHMLYFYFLRKKVYDRCLTKEGIFTEQVMA